MAGTGFFAGAGFFASTGFLAGAGFFAGAGFLAGAGFFAGTGFFADLAEAWGLAFFFFVLIFCFLASVAGFRRSLHPCAQLFGQRLDRLDRRRRHAAFRIRKVELLAYLLAEKVLRQPRLVGYDVP